LERGANGFSQPPLKGEGQVVGGEQGWRAALHPDCSRQAGEGIEEPLSPASSPLVRADLAPARAGRWRGDALGDGATRREAENRTIFAGNRAHGRVSLALAATPRGTKRVATREEGSLRVRFPNAGVHAPEAVFVNTAGGIAGGDRFAIDLALAAGARLTATTAAAEKVYRSLGPDACVNISAILADGAELTWLPQETILFARARLARTITVTLARSAKLLVAEMIVFGRAARGETVHEGSLADRWQVRRDGRLIFAEHLRLDGPISERLSQAAVAGGRIALGTVLIAPGDAAAVAAVRAASEEFHGEVGISAWNGVALARLAAAGGAGLRHDIAVLLSALGRRALPRSWSN
jgi:urease accessory protein